MTRAGNEELAAAAGTTLLAEATLMPRRARRSARDNMELAGTERFLERDIFGAIAIRDSSDTDASACEVWEGVCEELGPERWRGEYKNARNNRVNKAERPPEDKIEA